MTETARTLPQEVAEHYEQSSLLRAALDYANRGWPVIPIWPVNLEGKCTCPNPKCGTAGKHPMISSWTTQGTTDEDIIKNWWGRRPDANIGILTGELSGLLLLDVDTKDNGLEKLAELEGEHGTLPITVQAITGSGGKHILFKRPENIRIANKARFYQGLDVRSDGGMFVAAPSRHASGNKYEWIPESTPDEVEVADCPEWLIELMVASSTPKLQAEKVPETFIIEGGRNNTLTSLAGTMRRRGMTHDSILAALYKENSSRCRPPLPKEEVELIAQSVSSYSPSSSNRSFPLTELGNAERLIYHHGEDIRFCHPFNKWFIWDSKRWAIDNTGEVHRRVRDITRRMIPEADTIADDSKRKDLIKWELKSESSKSRRETIDHAKTLRGIPILPEDMDKHKWIFNVENGEIDLRTGELVPPRRENLITKLAPVTYDSDAKSPIWEAFLNKIMGGNQNLIDFLQRAIGYSLTGETGEQCLFILYGSGANGKSTFLDAITAMLGEDYAKNTPTQTLMVRRGESIPNDIAALKGSRFVTAIEAEEGQRLAESLVKSMTGGDKMTARFMRGEFFSFNPEFKLFLATNHKPQIRGTDNAIWRRIYLIPFEVTIPPQERDRNLAEKLRNELPGILNWALKGCLQWQKGGLRVPDEVRAATQEYRVEMDVLGDFLEECCSQGEGLSVENMSLRNVYKTWCDSNGERPVNQKVFTARLTERGFSASRGGSNGRRVWTGITLKEDAVSILETDDIEVANERTVTVSKVLLDNNSFMPSGSSKDKEVSRESEIMVAHHIESNENPF